MRTPVALRAAALGAIVATLLQPAAAQTPRSHTVVQVLVAGKPVDAAAGVTVTQPNGTHENAVRRGETIADGTRIDVPAGVVVVVASTGGKSTATLEPGSSVTFVSTGAGELVSGNGGKVLFSVVPASLDFFRVESGEALSASVHGTEFAVDAAPGAVSYTCTVGEVNILKRGYLVVGSTVESVALTDVISAASRSSATYHPRAGWKLGTFATYAEARAYFEAQLATARASGDQNLIRQATGNLARIEELQGNYAEALQSYRDEIAIARGLGDIEGQAAGTLGLASIANTKRQFDDAVTSYREALSLFQAADDSDAAAGVLVRLADVQAQQGQLPQALVTEQQSFALLQELGDKVGQARALMALARIRLLQDDDVGALDADQDALALFTERSNREGEADALRQLGDTETRLRDFDHALAARTQALAVYQELGDPLGVAKAYEMIGHTQRALRHDAEAIASYQKALALYRQLGLDGDAAIVNDEIIREQTQYGDHHKHPGEGAPKP